MYETDHERLTMAIESEILAGVDEMFLPRKGPVPAHASRPGAGGGLEKFRKDVLGCVKCGLSRERKNVVFGEGDPGAALMFIGEAPGRDEDIQGRPFVGRAGQLLTRIIASIGLERKDVFIANILKCRPPGNRNPMPEEIRACSPYLEAQISMISPRVICALGKFAAQTLLDSDTPISRLRGVFHDRGGIKVMPTYHPAYLLRNPGGKKEVWEDMKKIAAELGLRIPRARGGAGKDV